MLISVIIPNYNHALYLKQRIDSVLAQTYQDFEVIILDDCSPDNSREIIELYRNHPKVSQIIYNEKNSGSTFSQWNKGVEIAKGELIWIAESDDVADKQFLEKVTQPFSSNPAVGISYCQSLRMNEFGEVTGNWETFTQDIDLKKKFEKPFLMNGVEFCNQFLLYKNVLPNASAVVFRKHLYVDAGLADPNIKYSGDWDLWLRICLISNIYFTTDPLNYFRYHDKSVIRSAVLKTPIFKKYDIKMRIIWKKKIQKELYKLIEKNNMYILKEELADEALFLFHQRKLLQSFKYKLMAIQKAWFQS